MANSKYSLSVHFDLTQVTNVYLTKYKHISSKILQNVQFNFEPEWGVKLILIEDLSLKTEANKMQN